MAKPDISIRNWSRGISPSEKDNIGFAMMYLLDPHTRPGIIRPNPKMDADSDTAITDIVNWFAAYQPSGGTRELYAYDNKTAGCQLFRRTGGAWALVRTNTSSGDGQGLAAFGDSLYYASRTKLGQLQGDPTVGGNYNDSFQSLGATVDHDEYAPMAVFAGSLYVGAGRYVGRLEADEVTWDGTYLTLPEAVTVQATVVWNDRFVISTRNNSPGEACKIFIWDGIADFPELAIEVPYPGATALANHNNLLRAFIGWGIYSFTGSEFSLQYQIPKHTTGADTAGATTPPGSIALYKEQLLFAVNSTSAIDGIYSLGKHSSQYPEAMSVAFEVSAGADSSVYALSTFGKLNNIPYIYASWRDTTSSTTYGIDVLNHSVRYETEAYFVTDAFEVSNGDQFGKLLQGVRAQIGANMHTNYLLEKLTIKYRIDEDIDPEDSTVNWTTLGTIDNDSSQQNNQNEVLYGVYKRAKRIQFRVEFLTKSATGAEGIPMEAFYIY